MQLTSKLQGDVRVEWVTVGMSAQQPWTRQTERPLKDVVHSAVSTNSPVLLAAESCTSCTYRQNAEVLCMVLISRCCCNRDVGTFGPVVVDQVGVIHAIQLIASKHHDIFTVLVSGLIFKHVQVPARSHRGPRCQYCCSYCFADRL